MSRFENTGSGPQFNAPGGVQNISIQLIGEGAVSLAELIEQLALSLPIETALAILTEFGHEDVPRDRYRVEHALRQAAEQYKLFEERLRELDSSGDLIVRDLLREAEALVTGGRFDEADQKMIEAERHADLARAKVRANRGDLAKLRLRYRDAAGHYAEAARIVPEEEKVALWSCEHDRAKALMQLGIEFGEIDALHEALEHFENVVIPLSDPENAQLAWASSQNDYAIALKSVGERQRNDASFKDYLERAVVALEAALKVYGMPFYARDRSGALNNIGSIYSILGEKFSGASYFLNAIRFFDAASADEVRVHAPDTWLMAKSNLGNSLANLGRIRNDQTLLDKALIAHRLALEEQSGLNWAMTQNNIGTTLMLRGQGSSGADRIFRLTEAVEAYRLALEIRTKDRVPVDWATTIGNQGATKRLLAETLNDLSMAQEALSQMREAAETFRTHGHIPRAVIFEHQIPAAEALVARLTTRPT